MSHPISLHQRAALEAVAEADGFIRFDRFMDVALYHPSEGYYRRDRTRVGQSSSTDFFTASSLGPVFGELVVASCISLLRGNDPAAFTFVEFGAEAGRSVLDDVNHPFRAVRPVGVNDGGAVHGPAIVFSNELFDAQPFRRFRRAGSHWEELGAVLTTDGIAESQRPTAPDALGLPDSAPPGYHLDLPTGANTLVESIARQPWQGLFLAFDYGKSWTELIGSVPQGTARAYHQHRQKTQLLESMGEQDLTCHICWDHLSKALQSQRFETAKVQSQEAFLVGHAAPKLAEIMSAEATQMSPRKAGLMQLLHPSALGQKFQVLSAWRKES